MDEVIRMDEGYSGRRNLCYESNSSYFLVGLGYVGSLGEIAMGTQAIGR